MESHPSPIAAPDRSLPWTAGVPFVVPFHDHARIETLDAPLGEGVTRIAALSELTNNIGTVHGGMLFALGETAAAAAMSQLLWNDRARLRAITRRGSIEYLKPARGAITARAVTAMTLPQIDAALANARSIDVPLAVELRDGDGNVVATLHIEWFVGRPKP